MEGQEGNWTLGFQNFFKQEHFYSITVLLHFFFKIINFFFFCLVFVSSMCVDRHTQWNYHTI